MTRSEKLAIEHAFSRLINRSPGWSRHGSLAYPIVSLVKRTLNDIPGSEVLGGWCRQGFDEYQLAKYLGGQKVVKSRDALQITRPKPADINQAELWRKLVKGELATPDTWEVELSKGGDKKASCLRLLAENELGGLAILRNVRNMTKAGGKSDGLQDGLTIRPTVNSHLPLDFSTGRRL
jgi:hypothetical protein